MTNLIVVIAANIKTKLIHEFLDFRPIFYKSVYTLY